MKRNQQGHSQQDLPQEYMHDPERTESFARNELIYYVEHSPGLFTQANLTTSDLIDVLPEDYLPQEVRDSLEPALAVRLSQSNDQGPVSTLFRVKSPALNVVEEYIRFQDDYHSKQRGLELRVSGGTQAVVRHILPNWFNGIATHVGIGPHGPGGPPRAVTSPARLNTTRLAFKNERPPNQSNQPGFSTFISDEVANDDAVVYILDTIPARHRIQYALSYWSLLKRFEKILAPFGDDALSDPNIYRTEKATYIYAAAMGQDFSETYLPEDENEDFYAVGRHAYDSSDHGLFIAGIVHSLAPKAQIYVIQVINDNGVGTFMNFAAGFQKMAEIHHTHHQGCHAIVNCSFTLAIPIGDYDKSGLGDLAAYEQNHPGFKEQVDSIFTAINTSRATGATIFAAAGNDSARTGGQPPMEARYPAQFSSVTGVGALKKNLTQAAHYSNAADKPELEGVYAFGGDYHDSAASVMTAQGVKEYQDAGDGIISIFTGNLNIDVSESEHPHPSPGVFNNPTGYAEWKGTSFATPVIVGTVARLCMARGLSPEAAFQKIDLYSNRSPGFRRFDKTFQTD